ncbi:MAG TPA: hypothetical protein VFE96_05465 [Candidatus Bathyarchaeia archaeon]|jgi:hypothetical protein|nr:hypothetical protein [Candidatus Bathyarchaeia archaeon]
MTAVCPICGYNQGEERILVYHLLTAHKGIPHTQGEEIFLCKVHPDAGPMNHLEFVKHAQEKASNPRLGMLLEDTLLKPPKCSEVSVQSGEVTTVQQHLEATKPLNARPPEIRSRFNVAMAGAGIMIIIGYQLARLRAPLNLTGQTDIVAGLICLAGSLLYYVQPARLRLAAYAALFSSIVAWAPFLIFLIRIIFGQSLFGLYVIFLLLGPLLGVVGATMVLVSKRPLQRALRV